MRLAVKSLVTTLSIATAFSLLTLWLIDSWIKYPLFLFEIATISTLFAIVNDYDLKIVVKKRITIRNIPVNIAVDLALILSSIILLITNTLQTSIGLIQIILSLLCTSLLSGYALINILGIRQYFSSLETAVLSYISSYTLTAFLTLAFIPAPESIRTHLILGIFIGLGLASLLKHVKTKAYPAKRSFAKNIDILAITLALTFYALSFYFIYPGFALLSETDISHHYAFSVILNRAPDVYLGSAYILAHLHESTFISLSNPSLVYAQATLAMLNLVLPLAFYIMAKQYLETIDARLPSLGTLFWTLFTNSFGGFAWLYFVILGISSVGQSQLQLLNSTADKTYNGTVYGIFGLWYVPATVSFVLLMASIFLVGNKEIPRTKYFALFSILIAALYLTHVTEAVVFALFLAIYGATSKNENYRIDDAIKSTIIGTFIVLIVYYALSQITPRFIINTSLLISITGSIIALLSSFVFRRYACPRLVSLKKMFKVNKKFVIKTLVLTLFFAYIVAFLSWASLIDSFHTWQVDTIGLVPWFMYPLMLGINGLLAIIAFYYITEDTKSYRAFALFVAFMIFTFVAGRVISTINLYFFDAGYWEKRFIWFIKIFLALLASLPVIYAIDKLRKRNMNINVKTVASFIVIGTIVLYGISTTFLNLEYWNIVANDPANQPSSREMEAINAFKEILDNDPKTWLATVTGTSSAMATFAAPAEMLGLKKLLYTAYRPEMAFTQLYRHPAYDHPYIYLHNRDIMQLDKFSDRFLVKYISMLPLVYENSEVKIYNVSKLSPPQPNSDNLLILPFNKSFSVEQNFYLAYNILSQGLYNYTVAYDLDSKALNAKTIILAYDPPQESVLTGSFQGGKIVILNTNGYNFFGNDLFFQENSAFDAEKIEGINAALNLPAQVTVPKLVLKNVTISVLSQYIGLDNESPFIIRQNYGEGELFYVNIYPIAEAMHKNGYSPIFYNILGKLLDDLNLPKIDQNAVLNFDGYVKALHLNNDSKAETNSLIFPLEITFKQLDIQTKNGPISIYNVTDIQIKNNSSLLIEDENFTIEDGQGFYAVLKLNSTFTVKPSSGFLELKIITENVEFQITHVEHFSITPYNSVQLLARTPKLSASEVIFVEFYPSSSLQWNTRTYGQNLHVTGLTSFQIQLSDSYTILKNVKLSDSFTRDPPIVMFDELSTITTAIFWTLILLPIFLVAVFIYYSKFKLFKNEVANHESPKHLETF